jgi:hypothetical protein
MAKRIEIGERAVPLTAGVIVITAVLFLVLLSFAFKGSVHF